MKGSLISGGGPATPGPGRPDPRGRAVATEGPARTTPGSPRSARGPQIFCRLCFLLYDPIYEPVYDRDGPAAVVAYVAESVPKAGCAKAEGSCSNGKVESNGPSLIIIVPPTTLGECT